MAESSAAVARPRALSLTLEKLLAEAAAIAVSVLLLLTAAIWNGFPLTFYDTGAYLNEGLGDNFIVERSPVYSFFLRFGGAGHSLWWIAIIQAAMTAFVLVETARAFRPSMTLPALISIVALLTVATGLPWYVGQIEPDCFTAIVVMSIYLLAFHARSLGSVRTSVLLAVAAIATGAHPSHLGLSAGLAICVLAYRFLPHRTHWPHANAALPVLAFALGLGLVLVANYHFKREIFVSRAGPNFEFARLVQDGIAKRDLDAICPHAGLALCAYKDQLPKTADEWLWSDGPFIKLGRFEGTVDDSRHVVLDSLRRFPWLHLKAAASDAATQFVSLATGDQIEPQAWILYPDLQRFVPGQLNAYMHSRQQSGEIDFKLINLVHLPVAWLGLGGMLAGLWLAIRARARRPIVFFGFILIALLGNALICGVMSNPHDRYQSRLIWLPIFALCMVAPERPMASLRRPAESGT